MGVLYGWRQLEKSKRPVNIPKVRYKEMLNRCQKATIPPPRIGSDRGTKKEESLIIQSAKLLSHRKESEVGR